MTPLDAAVDARPKSARTRERILDAGAYVLSRKGYAATFLGDIASHAKCQTSAIYYYFESRETLLDEVIWLGIHRVHTHVAQTIQDLPSSTDPLDVILIGVEAHLRFVLGQSDYTTASIRNSGQIPAAARSRQLAEEQSYIALWRGIFDAAARSGALHAGYDLRLVRMLVLGALNWTTEWWQEGGESLDTLVENARTLIGRGLRPAPRTQD